MNFFLIFNESRFTNFGIIQVQDNAYDTIKIYLDKVLNFSEVSYITVSL